MPEPHIPEEQPPPPMPEGILAAADSKLVGMALLDSGEKVLDMSFVSSIPLHPGHERPAVPAPILCITVKTVLHLLHLYSYIGIANYLLLLFPPSSKF